VTTGHTMTGVAQLLLKAGAQIVLPAAIDRSVSPRVLQRLPTTAPDTCPHIGRRDRTTST
jgi:hypothetical protein